MKPIGSKARLKNATNNSAITEDHGFTVPSKSISCSFPLAMFLFDFRLTIDSFLFTVNLAITADKIVHAADKATAKGTHVEETEEQKLVTQGRAIKTLTNFGSLHLRTFIITTVDSFLWFLSTIVQEAMKRRPEMLKSSETIAVEEVVNFRTRSELLNFIIDRKINALSYGGMKELEKYIRDRLGVEIFADEKQRRLMNIFIEIRNIHTHNRGYINRLFLSRVGHQENFKFGLNKRFFPSFEEFQLLSATCLDTAIRLDNEIATKFHFKRKRFSTWHPERKEKQKDAN